MISHLLNLNKAHADQVNLQDDLNEFFDWRKQKTNKQTKQNKQVAET